MPMHPQAPRATRARLARCGTRKAPAAVEFLEARQLLSFTASINFQPSSASVPVGFVADTGSVYAKRSSGLTYGWNANNAANMRDRNSSLSPNQAYDTFALTQRSGGTRWDLGVPSGVYNVRVVAGDPGTTGGVIYGYNVEGKVVASGTPTSAKRWIDETALVRVSDGKLTVNNASGTSNNRIAFLTVSEVVADQVRAQPASNSKIVVSWADVGVGESGYRIERSTDGVNFSTIATVATNVTSYTDIGRSPAVTYRYRVRCVTSVGDSAPSPVATATIDTSPLDVSFTSKGISKVYYKGATLFDLAANPSDGLKIHNYTLANPDGSGQQQAALATSQRWDPDSREMTFQYSWGTLRTRYVVEGDQIRFVVTASNTTQDKTLKTLQLTPVTFRFPEMPEGFRGGPRLGSNVDGLTAISADYGAGQVVVVNDDVSRPLTVGYMSSNVTATQFKYNILVSTVPERAGVFERPIGPGKTDTYTVSMRFGYAGTAPEAIAADVYQKYVETFPSRVQWSDRRPIGMIFQQDSIAAGISATNPHGWWGDPKVDTKSSTGLANFKQRFLAGADTAVSVLKGMNAQGAIVWDLEGEQYKGGNYVGDPRVVGTTLPELEYANTVDEYFRKFTNAGLKVGVTIRPTQFVITGPNSGQQLAVEDPAQLMLAKVRYARERWGVRMFYIDSNSMYRPQDIAVLTLAYPDTLFIPENEGLAMYGLGAPYGEVRGGHLGTPTTLKSVYSSAFSVIEAINGAVADYRAQLVDSVRAGDILMFQGWYTSPNNALIKSIYDEALGLG